MADPAPLAEIDSETVPRHIAVIMDGNGRWATAQGLPRTEGHKRGEDALFEAVEGCLAAGVGWLTVYAFSTENWRRPKDEVRFLLNYSRGLLRRRRDELNERGVRIRFVGRRDWRVPRGVLNEMDTAESLTRQNTNMTLTIAFNYGGRAEVVDAIRAMIDDGLKGKQITEKAISRYMYDPEMPDPEVMVRTSGESRTSNYLMWQMAYTELIFADVLWPDFTREHLWGAIAEYQHRERRFGGV
ncbi:MAG: polyprenyl diphosphate synthase [Actinomycetota bacterium]